MLVTLKRLCIVLVGLLALFYLCAWSLSHNGFSDPVQPSPEDKPVKAVTIQDVLDANLPKSNLVHVSYPNFPFKPLHAFPDAEKDEHIIINEFHEAPMLADLDSMKPEWRIHFPESLPPVEERLPENPAVVRGPDGIGKYGGTWHRVGTTQQAWGRRSMYESYVRFDESGNLAPALAYDWTVGDNNKVFTFYLRKGHRFSDGRPFTTKDLLWVTNTIIGSKRWLSPPDWMQATDGSSLFYQEDILDWVGLANTIIQQLNTDQPTVGKQLFRKPDVYIDYGPDKIQQLQVSQEKLKQALQQIAQLTPGTIPEESIRVLVINQLNRVMKNRDFFDQEIWKDCDWDGEIKQLKDIGWSKLDKKQTQRLLLLEERNDAANRIERIREIIHQDGDTRNTLSRFNVLFFRIAYCDYVKKAEKTRVKVEAVPDENGDDSHIIRFTFNKPASFFLNKTATFMFYRVIGGSSEFDRLRHPDGHTKLFPLDVFNWQGFAEELLRQVQMDTVTPGGQLWKLLPDDVKTVIKTNLESEEWLEDDQEIIIEAINKAMASRSYYDPAGWAGIDFELEKQQIFTNNQLDHPDYDQPAGYVHVATRLEKVRRITEIFVCEDLRKYIESGAIDQLSDEQLFVFNITMFRKAFSDPAGDPASSQTLVAPNREMALDHAAQTAEKPYEGWMQWAYKGLGNYHPIYNPHAPSLRAWRVVSEKMEKNSLAIRNPYYYRVDEKGNQLPYLDAVINTLEPDREARMLKLKSGAVEFMPQGIRFQDYTVLKQAEKGGNYEVRLWTKDRCGSFGLYVHQIHSDPAFRKVAADPRFRHALSLAIDRQEIIDVVYNGIGTPAQYAIPKGSPYYSEKLANAFVEFDPQRANEILDEMGLDKRSSDGTRLIPVPGENGQPDTYVPMIYIVATKEATVPTQAVEMICNYWQQIGINARMKLFSTLNRLAQMGKLDIGVNEGGGSYFGPLLAGGFAPTHPAECLQWDSWANYLRNGGMAGEEPPDRMMELEELWRKVQYAPTNEQHMAAWQNLMDRTAHYLPVIGVLDPPGEVLLVKNNFKNVPKLALGGWMPHHPGNTNPEAYFIDDDDADAKKHSADSE